MTAISNVNFPNDVRYPNLNFEVANVVVQKFGGTSVGSLERIRAVAERALGAQRAGQRVVVVVSAMSGETDRLLALADRISPIGELAERDVIAASGEQQSAALTAMAIVNAGGRARSFLGSQLRILTDGSRGDARVRRVETARLMASLDAGEIPVVAGFQGVDCEGRITTLGRGGSDTTAVAIAAALGAGCEIFTDVDGVYTADPGICRDARKIKTVSYRQMLTLAALGAKVLHGRSVALAQKYEVPLQVRTSFSDVEGTWVVDTLEGAQVTGVACEKNLVRLEMANPTRVAATLCENGIAADSSLILRAAEVPRAVAMLGGNVPLRAVSRVSVVGSGLQVAEVTRLLRAGGIAPEALHASESAITVVLEITQTEAAMQILHDGFELAKGVEK